MTDEKNLVSTLIAQHRDLQKDLGLVIDELKNDSPDSNEIDKLLKQFTTDLNVHLELENNSFYVELLQKMKEKGQDTAKTEQFIAEMGEIGKAVMAFLGKYGDASSVESQITDFRTELSDIINTLNLRIESEEAGVYAYWGLF